jgi:2-polyprenyl-3-methyl-5-hydroxy-6-metoxy-1,4-benzoquinol methylase
VISAPENIQLESKPCPLGCSAKDIKVLSGRDMINHLPGDFDILRCAECELMRTNPRPTPNSMSFYYPDDYYPYQINKDHPKFIHSKMRQILDKAFIHLFRNFNTFTTALPDIVPGRVLEVGCASGNFMESLKYQGWKVEGLEFSPSAAENARKRGFKVHTGALETAPDPEVKFDLIIGWMVLEHLHDPVEALKKLRTWLKPGGWLVISIPNAGTLEFKLFKANWYALQLPNHLYHFTPKTLEKLMLQCGWKVEKVFHQRVLNNLMASIGLSLCRYKLTNKIGIKFRSFPNHPEIHHYFYPIAFFLGVVGQSGRMTVWARKH